MFSPFLTINFAQTLLKTNEIVVGFFQIPMLDCRCGKLCSVKNVIIFNSRPYKLQFDYSAKLLLSLLRDPRLGQAAYIAAFCLKVPPVHT